MAWWKKRIGENNVGKKWVSVRVRMRPNEKNILVCCPHLAS